MLNKKILLLVGLFLLLIPVFFYCYNFRGMSFSKNPVDWGVFGDYIGGVVNTVISFISLIVLIYISVTVAKYSSDENKKLNVLQKRLEVYDDLIKFLPDIYNATKSIDFKFRTIVRLAKFEAIYHDKIEDILIEMSNDVLICSQYYNFLFIFKARYDHLFKYDFESPEYVKLLDTAKHFRNSFEHMYNGIINNNVREIEDIESIYREHVDNLVVFINEIKAELTLVDGAKL